MLQIPKPSLFTKSKILEEFNAKYLSVVEAHTIIKPKQQQDFLKTLNSQTNQEKFYFTVDAKTNNIGNCTGVNKWLGFSENQFTTDHYNQIIHPSHAVLKSYYGAVFQQYLANEKTTFSFLQPLLICSVALKTKTSKYLYCKKECYAYQLGNNGTLVEYINVFTIIKEYENENFNVRLPTHLLPEYINEEKLNNLLHKLFEQTTNFSIQELRILKRYAQSKATTSHTIAQSFKIEKTTVSTYNKRILRKAERFFAVEFTDARQVAIFLKKQKLI